MTGKKLKTILFKHDTSGILAASAVLFVVLSLTSKGFLSAYNTTSNLQTLAVSATVGLAQMAVLSLGQFNLAVGSMGCLSGILMGLLMEQMGMPVLPALLLGVAFGGLLGALQGLLIAKTGINPFIITLSLLSVYQGAASVISRGTPFQNLPKSFMDTSRISFSVVPLMFVISILVGVTVFLLLRFLPIGRKLLACGANPRAAVFSGIHLTSTVVIGHAFSGALCGIAAILQIMRFGSAQLSVGGDWMMSSFMAPVLGGTLLSGGKISVPGTFVGALLVVLIRNALVLWGASTYTTEIFLGLLLLLAYEVDKLRKHMLSQQL